MTNEKEEVGVIDVDGNIEEFTEYTIVPNTSNEFLRLMILKKDSPAYGHLIEITSVETDEIEDSLSMRLGFEVIDQETNQPISGVYESMPVEDQAVFVHDMGNAFTAIITHGIQDLLKEHEELNVSE